MSYFSISSLAYSPRKTICTEKEQLVDIIKYFAHRAFVLFRSNFEFSGSILNNAKPFLEFFNFFPSGVFENK